jgi:hypothetical protein
METGLILHFPLIRGQLVGEQETIGVRLAFELGFQVPQKLPHP